MHQSSTNTAHPKHYRLAIGDHGEREIEHRLESYFDAFARGDLEEILGFIALDVVAYDMPPTLRNLGRDAYKESSEKWFISAFEFPIAYEMREQEIITTGDLGLVYGITHMTGRFKETGEILSSWLRHTIGLQKISGEWIIIHEHVSVPVDEEGMALKDLEPETERPIM
jgi:ketosteroid isomerase-like protein